MSASLISQPEVRYERSGTSLTNLKTALIATGVLLLGLIVAAAITAIHAGRAPERAVLITGALFAVLLATVPAAYLLRARSGANPGVAGLGFLTGAAVLLLGIYFFCISGYVFFPADFLTWSEGDFVNDILKFSVGYPLYSPQVNNDAFNYVPGPQLLTYFVAWAIGKGGSIGTFRLIQLIYTAIATFVATLCCRDLVGKAWPDSSAPTSRLWNTFWYAALFLIATNPITNTFAHNLHGDALAQLAAVAGFYLLLKYSESRSLRMLMLLAVFVPATFLIRQSLLAWAFWCVVYLAIDDRSWKRIAGFSLTAAVVLAAILGLCYVLWGQPFFYWTIYVLQKHGVSPLRSFQHILTAWPYFAAGLLGGAALLRGRHTRTLFALWLLSMGLLTSEAYTSGIAWMLNHMGPGSLLAGIWGMAGLAAIWEPATRLRKAGDWEGWVSAGAITAAAALLFGGMGLVRIPLRPIPDDAYRYVRDIEKEFQGQPASKVLLDAGTWIYFKQRVVMGDRAPSIGERGYSGTGDFSGMLSRIAKKQYAKILVRGFQAPDFVYDYYLWPKSSGIRQALINNYRVAGIIRGVDAPPYARNWAEDPYYLGEITILEPKTNSQGL